MEAFAALCIEARQHTPYRINAATWSTLMFCDSTVFGMAINSLQLPTASENVCVGWVSDVA